MSNESRVVPVELLQEWAELLSIHDSGGGSREGVAYHEVLAILAQPAAPVTAQEPVAWEVAERIANVPGVHEALQMFSEDSTGDAGVSLVREVLENTHADASEARAAIETLQKMGYTFNGGQLWKPPIGKKPDFDMIDNLCAQLSEQEALLRDARSDMQIWCDKHPDEAPLTKHLIRAIDAALSASAEPINDLCAEGAHEFVPFRSECVKCGEPYSAEPSAPVDERAEFEAWHRGKYPLHSMLLEFDDSKERYCYPSRREMYDVWQARAKLNGGA